MSIDFLPQLHIITVPDDVPAAKKGDYINRRVTAFIRAATNKHPRTPGKLEFLGNNTFALHYLSSTGDTDDAQALRTTPVDDSGSGAGQSKQDAGAKGNAPRLGKVKPPAVS